MFGALWLVQILLQHNFYVVISNCLISGKWLQNMSIHTHL